ncbi:MAG: tripartite tricarboxylate transporter substrate binding protein [Oscillospiraceae bacterium]|nr:tripartite tricarboxylate transporter substrate binding protein [Oscillospiraceae bacterium]
MRKAKLMAIILVVILILAACGGSPAAPAPAAPAGTPAAPAGDAGTAEVTFPTGPITIFNSSPAGAPADVMARELARSIEELTGVTVTVDNATGGGGGVMFGSVMARPTDGYTWGSFTAAQIVALQAGLSDDFPLDNFTWVSRIQNDHIGLAISTDSPFSDIHDLVAWAQANPGQLLIGGQGSGSGIHLSSLALGREAGFEFTYVPFDGGAEGLSALLGGHVDALMVGPTIIRPYYEAGQAIMITSTGESRPFAETPTNSELGFDIPFTQYRGIFVQTGVDPAIVQAIADLIYEATLTESFQTYLELVELEREFLGPEDFRDFVLADFADLEATIAELLN